MTEDSLPPPAAPVVVVRGSATHEELHALHQVLHERVRSDALLAWRRQRRRALRRRPEETSDR